MTFTLPFPPSVNSGIYRITDTKTGRFYIGSSVNIKKRWRHHCYRLERGDHANPILQRIWNADPARLSISIIKVVAPARDDLLRAEQVALDVAGVGANRECMNVLCVAGSHFGRKRTEETIAKLREINRGRSPSVEARAKMRAAKIGRKLTEAHRKKIGDGARGKKINRPKGIINLSLRAFTAQQIIEFRELRKSGASWRELSIASGRDQSATRRAILGITYRDVA